MPIDMDEESYPAPEGVPPPAYDQLSVHSKKAQDVQQQWGGVGREMGEGAARRARTASSHHTALATSQPAAPISFIHILHSLFLVNFAPRLITYFDCK